MGKPGRPTPERRDEVRRLVAYLHAQGLSQAAMMRKIGAGEALIKSVMIELGLNTERPEVQRREAIAAEVCALYETGEYRIKDIAKRLGVGHMMVKSVLLRAGIPTNRAWDGGVSYGLARQTGVNQDAVVARGLEGASVLGLAKEFGVPRRVITRIFLNAGIAPPTSSQANLHRFRDPEQRGRVVQKAHLVTEGSEFNAELADLLQLLGVTAERERSVGPYNLDLSVENVAIELHRSQRSPWAASSREVDRTRDLLGRGFAVCYMWVGGSCGGPRLGGAKHVVAWLQGAYGAPPMPGEYRMIRGCGQLVAAGDSDFDNLPDTDTRHRRCYYA